MRRFPSLISWLRLLVLLPLLFAVLASRITRGRWFYRIAFFAPYVVPSSAVCLIFAFMYTPQAGLVTHVFGWFGLTVPDFYGTTSGAWFAVVQPNSVSHICLLPSPYFSITARRASTRRK